MCKLWILIISVFVAFVIFLIIWHFIYRWLNTDKVGGMITDDFNDFPVPKPIKESESKSNMSCEKAIDKFVGSLSYFQAVNLRMVLLHAYSPYRSIEDIYTQASDEFSDSDKLKYDLREAINCPTPFLAEKEAGKAIQQAEKNRSDFLNKILKNAKETDKAEKENNDLFNKLKKEFDESETK